MKEYEQYYEVEIPKQKEHQPTKKKSQSSVTDTLFKTGVALASAVDAINAVLDRHEK